MKTLFTKTLFATVIVAVTFFSLNANAKIGHTKTEKAPTQSVYDFNLTSEINKVIAEVVSDSEKIAHKKAVKKQLATARAELSNSQVVNQGIATPPKIKFKVVIKD